MGPARLVIFVKAPRAGEVKTRLAQAIGPEAACAAYRQLVELLLKNLATLPDLELRFTPDDALAEIQPWLREGWRARPQGGGDLGERLNRACAEHFAEGCERLVIIGSDCPDVIVRDIEDAWAQLHATDIVLGPATDGGYWLIGLRAPRPALFEGIHWSTDIVLAATLARAKEANLKVALLRELSDVDTAEDWERFAIAHRAEP